MKCFGTCLVPCVHVRSNVINMKNLPCILDAIFTSYFLGPEFHGPQVSKEASRGGGQVSCIIFPASNFLQDT